MRLRRHHFRNINYKLIASAFVLLLSNALLVRPAISATRESDYLICSDFMFVFARGSGAEVNSDRDFKPFKAAVDEVFGGSGYSYSFYELGSRPEGWSGKSYPAPGIGISSFDRFTTSLGALFSGGEMNNYGDSVEDGATEAMTFTMKMRGACPNTKVVLAGYSQGAQVVSKTLQKINPKWIFAALTFGDPKLFLPEGRRNLFSQTTAACRGESYSEYRAFVPDCYAYEGILGGYQPYQPSSEYSGKLKAYCQFHDVICSSFIDLDKLISGHATYAAQGTYKRGIQDVFNMVRPRTYNRPNQDLAILFDNTGSMGPLLAQFQHEAITAANRVLRKGGKVALYTYGDLEDSQPVELCSFETCDSSNIEDLIKGIEVSGGGDLPESLLSASYTLMRRLKWDIGANKSLIVLTDANYHNPDRDGITLDQVVALSKSIDPVNFYILTDPAYADSYAELAELTGGAVYTSDIASAFDDLETEILSREVPEIYISTDLPAPDFATVTDLRLTKTSDSSVHLDFVTDGVINFITLNDYAVGFTEDTSVEITDLDLSEPITICVSSASASGFRGDAVCASTAEGLGGTVNNIIPKAPNTGKSK
ncbi:cutinase family protein [Candidatus Saccharibacteria bacterium]|nr:cutinase family protein [Candidatus Saccharibacteria bacterium]